MVILKNIQKTKDSISADYYPEGKGPKGFMKIRLSDGEVMEHENVCSVSAPHVLYELRRLVERDSLPTEKTVLWY